MVGYSSKSSKIAYLKHNFFLSTVQLHFRFQFLESIWRKIGIDKKWEIVFFVFFSSILMHLLTNRKEKIDFTYFWFYTPPIMDVHEKSNDPCSHEKTCLVHFCEGCSKYFLLGYAVNVIKKLLPRMGSLVKNPSNNMGIFFSESNLYFGLFIGSYVGFYRVLICYLTRISNIKKTFHGLIAGLFSGLTYAISPNLQVLVIAITTTLQMVYSYISKYLKINSFWQSQLLFMICHGYLLQEKFFSPKTCSSYYAKMIDACTNNVYQEIYKNLIRTFLHEY
nr:transmembrane protein 135-like [Leptinotarsa decemlineata]